MGRCKLCLRDAVNLQDSHFLPAGIYRILRDEGETNPNPCHVTSKGAVQTSKQMKARLLCKVCEEKLNKSGENWVLGYGRKKDGSFPLASLLALRIPDVSTETDPTKVYYTSKIPEINISALSYCAASILWRGSIYPWNSDGSTPVTLGPFQEQLRQYLNFECQTPFPKNCVLWVVVREGGEIDRLTYTPIGKREGKCHFYKFPMPGFAFTFIIGKNISANHREKCFVHGANNPIFVTSILENILMKDAVKLMQKSRKL